MVSEHVPFARLRRQRKNLADAVRRMRRKGWRAMARDFLHGDREKRYLILKLMVMYGVFDV